jgi:predicted anti-sigma-YlaC factor YlaD
VLSCTDVLAELAGYLEQELDPDVRRRLEEHLAHCRTCRVVYDSTRKTLRIVSDSGSFDLPGEVSEKTVQGILSRLRSRS